MKKTIPTMSQCLSLSIWIILVSYTVGANSAHITGAGGTATKSSKGPATAGGAQQSTSKTTTIYTVYRPVTGITIPSKPTPPHQ